MLDKIRFANYSMRLGKRHEYDWYEWCVFVDEPAETIGLIRSVEYVLHPTFPDPVREVSDKARRFAMFSSGWGEFTIDISVTCEDSSVVRTRHDLRLREDDWPKLPSKVQLTDPHAQLVYDALFDPRFRWRRVDTIVRKSGLPERQVSSILHELRDRNLARVSPDPSIDNKELWGPTAVVGISPRL